MREVFPFYGFILVSLWVSIWGTARRTKGGIGREWNLNAALCLLFLCITWMVTQAEPAHSFGLTVDSFTNCSLGRITAVSGIIFAINRLMRGYLLSRRVLSPGSNSMISSNGVFEDVKTFSFCQAALTGVFLIGSQTLCEELAFRGLVLRGSLALMRFLVPPKTELPCTLWAQGILFGLVHFLPMRAFGKGLPWTVLAYSFVMPASSGILFAYLNADAGSLWPGWLIHWGVNYGCLLWNKIGGVSGRRF